MPFLSAGALHMQSSWTGQNQFLKLLMNHRMRSFQFMSFLSLYNILTLTLVSNYIPIKVTLKQAAIIASRSQLFQVISKQAAVMISHHHLYLFFGANIWSAVLQPLFLSITIQYLRCCPFINKHFRIESFLDFGRPSTGFCIWIHQVHSYSCNSLSAFIKYIIDKNKLLQRKL